MTTRDALLEEYLTSMDVSSNKKLRAQLKEGLVENLIEISEFAKSLVDEDFQTVVETGVEGYCETCDSWGEEGWCETCGKWNDY